MYSRSLRVGQIPTATQSVLWPNTDLLLWLIYVLFRCFLRRSWCCRLLFQTVSTTATSRCSYTWLYLLPTSTPHSKPRQRAVPIRNVEPACSQTHPFCNAKCCWGGRGTDIIPAVQMLQSCTSGLQDQLNLSGAASDTSSSTVAQHSHCIQIPNFFIMEHHSKLLYEQDDQEMSLQWCPSSFQNTMTALLWGKGSTTFRWDTETLTKNFNYI